jgi:hypothetical protein
MKRLLLPFFVVLSFLVGADAGEKESGSKPPPQGFTSLFNGKDLTGWKDAGTGWKVANGLIHYDGNKGGKNLATVKNYKDFEMYVDWKITKGGASGIYLRGKPRVQIWDFSILTNSKELGNDKGSGGLSTNPPKSDGKVPLEKKDKKIGDWNTFYIKMVRTKVTVVLNNSIVVDNAVFLDGKVPSEGPFELEMNDTPLWFRNVFVREIVSDKK